MVLLAGGLNLWLMSTFNWNFMVQTNLSCKILPFIIYTMLDLSVGLIVTTTICKLFAVSRPLHAYKMKHNHKNSNIKIILLFCFFAIVNSHFLFSHSIKNSPSNEEFDDLLGNYVTLNTHENLNESNFPPDNQTLEYTMNHRDEYHDYESQIFKNIRILSNKKICTYKTWDNFYEFYWIYIDASIYSFLPFLLLSIFNVLIIRYLKKAENDGLKFKLHYRTSLIVKTSQRESEKINQKYDSVDYGNRKKLFTSIDYKNQNLKYTIRHLAALIILINISFCILSMPMVILQIMHQYNTIKYNTQNSIYDLFTAIAEIFQYLNHSTNFFFYCLSAKSFRNELKMLFKSFNKFSNLFKANTVNF